MSKCSSVTCAITIDNHEIHLNLTQALGDLLYEVQHDVRQHRDDLTAVQQATQHNTDQLTAALSCAKLGRVWDPNANPAVCRPNVVHLADSQLPCNGDNKGMLRFSEAARELQVRDLCAFERLPDNLLITIPFI